MVSKRNNNNNNKVQYVLSVQRPRAEGPKSNVTPDL